MVFSIRYYILWGVLTPLFVGMMIISTISYFDSAHEVEEIFDTQLAHSARILQGIFSENITKEQLNNVNKALDFGMIHEEGEDYHQKNTLGHVYESKIVFQLWDKNRDLLVHSLSASTTPFASFDAGYTDTQIKGYRWRVFRLYHQKMSRWFFIAEREDVRGELVNKIAMKLVLPIIVGLPLLAIIIWICIGRGLAPLTQIADSIRKRNPLNLNPIPTKTMPREIKPLVAALNRLLTQLDETLEREKRFTADAAHELRTPLSVLKIHTQNALGKPSATEKDASLRKLLRGIDRSTRLVEQLLSLARLEHGLLRSSHEKIDLRELVQRELREIVLLALEKKQELVFESRGAAFMIEGHEASLLVLIKNLVHNAIHYTPLNGSINIEMEEEDHFITLRVTDTGAGVPAQLRRRIFDRFFRIDSGKKTGSGLGLSIVQRVVKTHGAKVRLTEGPNKNGLCFSVAFHKASRLIHP